MSSGHTNSKGDGGMPPPPVPSSRGQPASSESPPDASATNDISSKTTAATASATLTSPTGVATPTTSSSTNYGSKMARSSSTRSNQSSRHRSRPSESGANVGQQSNHLRRTSSRTASTHGSPPHHYHGSRHPSLGSMTTRPLQPLSTDQRSAFEQAVASSSLASTSTGLQALLRDHQELVSSSLAKAAGSEWSQLHESARGSRPPTEPGSGPSTPGDEQKNLLEGPDTPPAIGEGGFSTGNTERATNLGSAGESLLATMFSSGFVRFRTWADRSARRSEGKQKSEDRALSRTKYPSTAFP
ncbi:unnamed protein product [Jaminaea pallidilutea]